VLRWLEQPGVRLVHLDGEWSCPVNGAARDRARIDPVAAARVWAPPFGESAAWVAATDRLPLAAPAWARARVGA